jgi:Tfp pilus assembly protein PilX
MIYMRNLNFKRRLADEAGFVLPSAIIVLFILTILTGAAIGVAVQTSTSTTRDNNVKAELAAAEAGLQVATYRMSQLGPKETECITGAANAAPTSGVYCAGSSAEPLGNGATFQYWTSKALTSGECAGKAITTESGITQRCIISEGLVNSVKPGVRLQTRVTAPPGESLFSVHGVLGLSEVKVTGSVKVPAVVASNEKIIGEGSANFEKGFELCPPKGSFKPAAGGERKKSGVKIAGKNPEADPELEKTRKEGPPECLFAAKLPASHATEASNEDSRIGTTDKLTGGKWSEAKHELTLEGISELTLAGSKYYFCNFKMPSGGPKLKIAAGAKVEIFIDSNEDKESKCGAETGHFEVGGGSKVENETKNPADLLIEIYGKGIFSLANGSEKTLEAAIYDPGGEVEIVGGPKFKGGIVGNIVHLENGSNFYEWNEELNSLANGNPNAYSRKAWEQCTPGSGAAEGC